MPLALALALAVILRHSLIKITLDKQLNLPRLPLLQRGRRVPDPLVLVVRRRELLVDVLGESLELLLWELVAELVEDVLYVGEDLDYVSL